jgi:hypothetical protein
MDRCSLCVPAEAHGDAWRVILESGVSGAAAAMACQALSGRRGRRHLSRKGLCCASSLPARSRPAEGTDATAGCAVGVIAIGVERVTQDFELVFIPRCLMRDLLDQPVRYLVREEGDAKLGRKSSTDGRLPMYRIAPERTTRVKSAPW